MAIRSSILLAAIVPTGALPILYNNQASERAVRRLSVYSDVWPAAVLGPRMQDLEKRDRWGQEIYGYHWLTDCYDEYFLPSCPGGTYKELTWSAPIGNDGACFFGFTRVMCVRQCNTCDPHGQMRHGTCNARENYECTAAPPPPSPPPSPPPPMSPQACQAAVHEQCMHPPFLCTWQDADGKRKFVYDESNGDDAVQWNEQCGDHFWTVVAPTYDWNALQDGVTACTGGVCTEPQRTPSSAAQICSETCDSAGTNYNGNGCTFHLERFAAQLVYLSELRAASVLSREGRLGNATAQQEAVAKMQVAEAAMGHFRLALGGKATDPASSAALVDAAQGAMGTMAALVGQMSEGAGFVPSFNMNFYTTRLRSYMDAFGRLMASFDDNTKDEELLHLFASNLRTEQAQLTGEASVTKVTQAQTVASIQAAIAGMKAALDGLKSVQHKMYEARDAFKEALQEYETEQEIKLAIDIITAVASMAMGGFGSGISAGNKIAQEVENSVIDALKKESIGYILKVVDSLVTTTKKVVESAISLAHDGGAVGKIGADFLHSMDVDFDPSTIRSSLGSLTEAATSLNALLPGRGTGYWEEYVAQSKYAYNPYLTGYSSSVNAAAQAYIDQVKAQAAYGNDFTTAGLRYVAALQQYMIDAAQVKAGNHTRSAMEDTYKVLATSTEYDMAQQSIIGVQLSTLALQMQTTTRQLCLSYAYQTTRMFHQCTGPQVTGSDVGNPLDVLCTRFSDGMPAFTPFANQPCASTVDLASRSRKYMQAWRGVTESANQVTDYVNWGVWGKAISAVDSPFMAVTLKVWDPPKCGGGSETHETRVCNRTIAPSPSVSFINGTSCLPADTSMPEDMTCCNVTMQADTCTYNPPGDGPYITRAAFERFTNESDAGWGRLSFTIDPASKYGASLVAYDEVFVRGTSVYLEGAEIQTEAVNLNALLTPSGQMTSRVLDRKCAALGAGSQCAFTNYTFVGAPSGSQSTVSYMSKYHNLPCTLELDPKPVFDQLRELRADGPSYCTNLQYVDFETGGDPRDMYDGSGHGQTPYNFASLYSTFELVIFNDKSTADSAANMRSRGIDLAKVSAIQVGMWLKTDGLNNGPLDGCDAIARVSADQGESDDAAVANSLTPAL